MQQAKQKQQSDKGQDKTGSQARASGSGATAGSGDAAWASYRGRKLGRYTVVDHLDSGGMAEIFLAANDAEGGFRKELVVKVLQSRYQDNAQVVAMFRDEARIGARLNHPSIVDIYDAGNHEGQHFIAMEYIEGRILTQLIKRGLEVGRPLPLGVGAFICSQVAEGLSYMYEGRDRAGAQLGVVHRDISPTNIIISDRGHTKIIDFGIATDHGDRKEDWEGRAGKYSYMSPEQVQGLRLDGRSDVFSLGIILYEITLGKRLYRGKPQVIMKRIVEEEIRPPTFIDRSYPPALEKIVMKALAKRPEDRYANAEDLGRDLDAFVASLPERVADRQVAAYVQSIEAPEAQLSDAGVRRAAAFVGEDDDFEDEELDFDRGAAGGWRVASSVPPPPQVPRAAAVETPPAPATPPPSSPATLADLSLSATPEAAAAQPARRGRVGPIVIALVLAVAGAVWAVVR